MAFFTFFPRSLGESNRTPSVERLGPRRLTGISALEVIDMDL